MDMAAENRRGRGAGRQMDGRMEMVQGDRVGWGPERAKRDVSVRRLRSE